MDIGQLFFNGLVLGASYAVVALGFVLIFKASGVFNFAQGELLTVGACTMAALTGLGLPWMVALLGAMFLTGLLGITITGDAFNLFVFLEISSLSSYVLIALGRDRRALTAAFQYLVMGTIGATFIVIGVGLLYMATGTLNMLVAARDAFE